MKSKINCKHGLDRKQEIQARRLRVKLEQGDEQVFKEYKKIWKEWFDCPKGGFTNYLEERHPVHYSAFMRACSTIGIEEICIKLDQTK